MNKDTLFSSFAIIALLSLTGCFPNQEAPAREVTATSLTQAVEISDSVERVNLAEQKLFEVPAELAKMSKLKTLYLAGNSIRYFSSLSALKGIQVLDLNRVKLSAAPSELASLTSLRDLYLSGCGISEFPEFLSSLQNLRYINLDRNSITVLPSSLPPSLRWLRLNYNKLTSLPAEIGKLTKLERIYLRNNGLTSLPAEIVSCQLLEDIDLSGNKLTEFPALLCDLPALRNIDLSGNKEISKLPDDATLQRMKSLRTLSLTGTSLSNEECTRIRNALPDKCVIIF